MPDIVNFGGNVRFTPRHFYEPRTEDEVLAILDRHAHDRIRVVGSRHSWSEACVSLDVLVDLKHFNQVALNDSGEGNVRATAGGGCRIDRLLDEIQSRSDTTMPTLGLVTEQTIAGAISTATHGSGRHSLSHYVDEIRVAAYDAATGKARVYTWSGGEELRAARCAVGCLGIILSVTFRCVPKYLVSDRLQRCRDLADALAGEQEYPLQQFYLVPWQWGWYAQRRKVVAGGRRSRFAGLYRRYWFLGIDIGYHLQVKLLAAVLRSRRMIHFFYRRILPPIMLKNVTVVDHSDRALTMEHELFRHMEIEIFVAGRHLSDAADFVRDVLCAFDSPRAELPEKTRQALQKIGMEDALAALRGTFTQHYVVTFRKVLPDDALIAMTADAEEPGYAISLITYVEPRDPFRALGGFLLTSMIRLYGARPHWGKYCPLTQAEGAALYPQLEDFRRIARSVDPQGVFQNEFVGRVLGFTCPADASSP
jgi:hypothetical protein